jgi:predicted nucleic acid-binding Zn ribbon protein
MPEPLASHAHPVRYSDGLLYVHIDTPAWASRLRQQLPTLTASLKKEAALRDLVEVRFRVVPRGAAPDAPVSAAPPSRVSAAAAAVIQRSAADIANPELRAALERLARRNESSSPAKRRR